MTDLSKCPFCEKGQSWRIFAWRLVKDMSRSEIQEILKERKLRQQMIRGKNA